MQFLRYIDMIYNLAGRIDKNKMVCFRMIYDRLRLRGEPIGVKKPESIDLSKIINCKNFSISTILYLPIIINVK